MAQPHWLKLSPRELLSRYNAQQMTGILHNESDVTPPTYRGIVLNLYIFHDNRLQLFRIQSRTSPDEQPLICPRSQLTKHDNRRSIRDTVLAMVDSALRVTRTLSEIQFVDFSEERPLITGQRMVPVVAKDANDLHKYGVLDIAILLSAGNPPNLYGNDTVRIGTNGDRSPRYLRALNVSRSDISQQLSLDQVEVHHSVCQTSLSEVFKRYYNCDKRRVCRKLAGDKQRLQELASQALTAALLAKQHEPLLSPKPVHGLIAYCADWWDAGLFFLLMNPIDWKQKIKRDADDFQHALHSQWTNFTVIGDFSDNEVRLAGMIPHIEPELQDDQFVHLKEEEKAPTYETMLSTSRCGRFRVRWLMAANSTVYDAKTRASMKLQRGEDGEDDLPSRPGDQSPPGWIKMQREDYMDLGKWSRRG